MRDLPNGTRVNRYEIRESVHISDLIGIYKAYDTKLERYVLFKTILHSVDYSREGVDYFLNEARALANLAHPNIAKVLDCGIENGDLYLISELVTGRLLSDLMNQPMPWQYAINILLPITDALIYAHSRGILHRDLKPDTIIINTDNQPILSDFSLMRIIENEETRDMTGTNVGLGTPGYISPEQGQGMTVDFRSDIYSLGVIFFEMVTGKKLFYATSSMEIVIQHIKADPPRPRTIIPDLPRAVEAIILKAISKEPQKRYQSMEDFSNALKKVVVDFTSEEQRAVPHRSRRFTTVAVAGFILLMIGMLYSFRIPLGRFPSIQQFSASATPTLTRGPSPLSMQTTRTSTPTSIETPHDLQIFFQLSDLPVPPGKKIPASHTSISLENVASLVELARWGIPEITQMAFVNNGQNILASTSAGIYFLKTEDLTTEYLFDTAGSVIVFAVSDDGEWLATGDDRGSVGIWNIRDGQLLYKLNDKVKRIVSLDFSPDKSKLVFCDTEKTIYLWDFRSNWHATFEKRHTLNINKVLFLDDNQTVISGGDDFQVMIWDALSVKWLGQFAAAQKINDMSLSPDGKYLALALNDATLQVFDFPARQPVNKIADRSIVAPFTHIHFLPNGTNFLTASADGFVRIWNTLGSGFVWESSLPEQGGGAIKILAMSQSGSNFVVGFKNGLVEVWDLVTKTRDVTRDYRSAAINRIVISPDDRLLAYQLGNTTVEVISIVNTTDNTQIAGKLPRGNPISPNSSMIGVQSGELILYSLSATQLTPLYTLYGFPSNATVNYSPDNKLITAYSAGIFRYWSTASGMILKPSVLKAQGRCLAIYRQDESFIAAGSEIGVLHADDNLQEFCRIIRGSRATSEEFLPDGSITAISLQNQLIEIWDFRKSGEKINITTRTPGHVLDVSLSSDGKLLAVASAGGAIEIYDLETLNLIKTLELQTGPVNQVLFSNDSRYLIAGLSDGTLRFFGLLLP